MKKQVTFFAILLFITPIAFGQNVGIGITNPTAKFHTVGSVKFDTLSGNGIRPVFVDASGKLFATIPESTLPVTTVTNSNSQSIPDNNCTGVTSNIVLSALPVSVLTTYIKATVNITHTYMSDLKIYLVAPNGNILNLWNGDGGSSDDLVNTIFTDAGILISSGASPYTGNFIAAGNLSAVCSITPTVTSFSTIGGGVINPNGTWALKIVDQAGTDIGILNNWTLTVDPNSTGKDGVWGLKGNAGNNNFNFIGTTDNIPFNIRINNQKAGSLDYDLRNIFLGIGTGSAITSGNYNIGIGDSALYNNGNGSNNVAIGKMALFSNTTGGANTATGYSALSNNTTGYCNTAQGYLALGSNSVGINNTATGFAALRFNTGSYNTASGVEALYNNTGGGSNTATGNHAMYNNTTGTGNTATGDYSLSSNTTGFSNAAYGLSALLNNTTGKFNTAGGAFTLYSNTTADENTGFGYNVMSSNTTGDTNTAVGSLALHDNTTGSHNTAIGRAALYNNTTGFYNTAGGSEAMLLNTTGYRNSAYGAHSLVLNSSGSYNTAQGYLSQYNNTTGNYNTAIGSSALTSNTSGFQNTAVGWGALSGNVNGNWNSAFGDGAGSTLTAGSNNTVIGSEAQVPNSTGNNQVRIGNNFITYAGIQVAWTITSDSRYKSQIQNSNLGLNFINQLRPVSYFRNNDKNEKLEYGFIAQEVEHTLQQSGAVNSGIISKDDAGMYSMRYNDLMAPMVKAIQEQQAMIDDLKKEIKELKSLLIKK